MKVIQILMEILTINNLNSLIIKLMTSLAFASDWMKSSLDMSDFIVTCIHLHKLHLLIIYSFTIYSKSNFEAYLNVNQ